ncbi:MAG TPA: HNH endonuclease signature motif containing protein [Mycobacteriales bacterium]|nr:HNH endonuclease signature motif containing protein [Mycobacteriales bacterium]
MTSVRRLADRDGAVCWLCGNGVDLSAPAGSPWAGSVDHVVPRARGGGNEPGNLRLAHRSCNSRRGSRLPELDWPRDVPVVDHTEVWPVVRRAVRRPGEWEVVGVVVGEEAAGRAHDWLGGAVPDVLGGAWEVQLRPLGSGLHALALRTAPRDAAPRSRGARRAS